MAVRTLALKNSRSMASASGRWAASTWRSLVASLARRGATSSPAVWTVPYPIALARPPRPSSSAQPQRPSPGSTPSTRMADPSADLEHLFGAAYRLPATGSTTLGRSSPLDLVSPTPGRVGPPGPEGRRHATRNPAADHHHRAAGAVPLERPPRPPLASPRSRGRRGRIERSIPDVTGAGQGPGGTSQGKAFEVVSLDARPELTLPALELLAVGWPEFMQHDPVAERHQARLATELAGFQALLLDDKDELAALGVAIPFAWDGTLAGLPAGWDAVVARGVADLDAGRRPTALSALSVTVAPARRRQGLSRLVIQALKDTAARAGLGTLLAPVRPSGKSAYPLTPMERYVHWARPDGTPFDPWLRTHWRLGGEVLAVCPASMEITARVAAWEAWTGLAFPETGPYVVPGALVPVAIDRERDRGRYVEPNVWVRHRCGANLPT